MSYGSLNLAPVFASPAGQTFRLAKASSVLHYYGNAAAGTTEATAAWQIQKVTLDDSGDIVKIEYPKLASSAQASSNYAYVWNDGDGFTYASYTYA